MWQLAATAAHLQQAPANLRELRHVGRSPDDLQRLEVSAPGLHRREHGARVPVGAMVVGPDQVPHDRGAKSLQNPVRSDDARPTCSPVEVVVAGTFLAGPDRLSALDTKPDLAAYLIVGIVAWVVQADDADGLRILLVLGHFVTDVSSPVLRYKRRVREPTLIKNLAQRLGVGAVRGALVPDADVIDLHTVNLACAFEPLEDVLGGQLGVLERAS
mmetsp:Transcript_15387/g.46120  ORF Transcript_15387/g.46120 Transcript_15387/m.46120 type:complete len:215 (+) Transcript_15387:1677-2321(+)